MRRLTIFAALLLAVLLVSLPGVAQQDVITTIIGGGPNNIPALNANLYNPEGVAIDSSGNFYIASYNQHRVFKVTTSTGKLTVVAGTGIAAYGGDGVVGGAALANLNHPVAVTVDATGNVYIADTQNCVVRKVDTANTITTIAGTNACGFSGDGGKGTAAQIYYPEGLALDSLGNLFIGDYYNCRVRRRTFRRTSSPRMPATEPAATPATVARPPLPNWLTPPASRSTARTISTLATAITM